jgi:transposase-like protein
MTSRTNHHPEGRNQGGAGEVAPADLESRRQLAVQRYLDGDPIERICQEMGCSKSWLYKWKNRYQAAEPTWSQEFSRRPKTTPAKTPEAIEAAIIELRRTLSPEGSEQASARGLRDHLCHHPIASIPSLRTIYRILNRQRQEGPCSSITIDNSTAPLAPPHMER